MIKQYKELVATDLYIVAIYDNKSIDVYNRYENESWNTRQFGKKIIDALGGGAPAIADETYCVYTDAKGTVICGSKFEGSTKEGLRTVAAKYKIKYDEAWNTQQFGKKVIEALR